MRGRGAAAVVWLIGACATVEAQVALRGGGRVDGAVVAVGREGVTVREPGGTRTLAWGRVRAVEGEHAEAVKEFASLADRCWRALSRLERGDAALAEPALEALFDERLPGPTGASVALGLLSCRLARGATLGATAVWLEWIALGAEREGAGRLASAVDAETLLAPTLAPIFVDSGALRAFAAGAIGEESEFGALYRVAARMACGLPAGDEDEIAALLMRRADDGPGLALVRAVVAAQYGGAEQRAAARSELLAGADKDAGAWTEAWRRAAMGRSWAREEDAASKRKAALEFLHVPARFGETQPALAALALHEAAEALRSAGDADSAEALRAEARMAFPGQAASAPHAGALR